MDEQLKQIGERLRGLRDVLDISTEEVAALCGISVQHYEQMESGESELSVANLQKIAKKYGAGNTNCRSNRRKCVATMMPRISHYGLRVERLSFVSCVTEKHLFNQYGHQCRPQCQFAWSRKLCSSRPVHEFQDSRNYDSCRCSNQSKSDDKRRYCLKFAMTVIV